jgi:cyclophilin family peptidyl-prolyl cis-trans isomerase/uncharacterized SAM-binding protein YcdF (DUF218 family)
VSRGPACAPEAQVIVVSVIVVLGCGVALDGWGHLRPGALGGRLDAAARLYAARGGKRTLVVVSGGRRWKGGVEADVMARELARRGVPEPAIVRERCSLSTRENARFSRDLLVRGARGGEPVALVTCDWHMPRASALFRRAGFVVEPVPATGRSTPWRTRAWQRVRERVLRWLVLGVAAASLTLAALGALAACSRARPRSGAPDAEAASAAQPAFDLAVLAAAEDARNARQIPGPAQRDRDPVVRRRAARAVARILDGDDGPLLRALQDDDPEVVAWGAFGLGESCKMHEDAARAHVRALAARLASLEPTRRQGAGAVDPHAAVLRALGRCGGGDAEQTLCAWLAAAGEAPEAAAYALGDLAARRGALSADSAVALLDAAQRSPPLDAALYAFGRTDPAGASDLRARLLAVARSALARAGAARIFAVRALGRSGSAEAATDLERVLVSGSFTPAERAEAAHALAGLRKAGQVALANAVRPLAGEARAARAFEGDAFGVLLATLRALGDEAPRSAEADLSPLAHVEAGDGSTAAALRRISALRCAAAARLARGAWDADVLRGCDVGDGEAGEDARLRALDRGELTGPRRAAWLSLVRSKHIRVREAALEVMERHPELGGAAIDELAAALSSPQPGVVARAADVVQAHPERVTLPGGPAIDPRVATALRSALSHPWSADLVETRVALVDASLAVHLDDGHAYALAACADPNATVRARAEKAIAAGGDKGAACPRPDTRLDRAPELGHELAHPVRVSFDTDSATLAVRFDPALAPIAATRFVSLARSGFYNGILIHRVVPGFVVQLGDRGGDGYGGSGQLLRCETSPVSFEALDVGVALAGRDTGSSQIFVALARQPHLDGEYAWVGHADGDWDGIAEGDVVREAHVEE